MAIDKTSTTIETYNNIVEEYIDFYKDNIEKGFYSFQKEISYLASKLNDNALILDVGTAIGECPRFLTEKSNKSFNVIGIDTSKNMIEKARNFAPKAQFIQMDMRDLQFESDKFDAIICFATLIHVNDEVCKEVLKKFDLILKKNGFIAINVMEHVDKEKEIFVKEPFNPKYMMYYNRYSKEFFLDFFNENNFVVDKIFENKIYKESEVGDDLNGTNEFTIIAKKN